MNRIVCVCRASRILAVALLSATLKFVFNRLLSSSLAAGGTHWHQHIITAIRTHHSATGTDLRRPPLSSQSGLIDNHLRCHHPYGVSEPSPSLCDCMISVQSIFLIFQKSIVTVFGGCNNKSAVRDWLIFFSKNRFVIDLKVASASWWILKSGRFRTFPHKTWHSALNVCPKRGNVFTFMRKHMVCFIRSPSASG